MPAYEYTAIPAPSRGEKTKGAKTGIERFAATIADTLNDMARDGWEYVRAETLPAEERSGLTSRTTVYHNLLIFRRATTPVRAWQPEEPAQVIAPVAAPQPQPQSQPPVAPQAYAQPPVSQEPVAEPVRAPFSQPMRATPKTTQITRVSEPPLSAPAQVMPIGPRLGPASR